MNTPEIVTQKIVTQEVIKDDGRYLIFYTFPPQSDAETPEQTAHV